jgi:hypothetical protein
MLDKSELAFDTTRTVGGGRQIDRLPCWSADVDTYTDPLPVEFFLCPFIYFKKTTKIRAKRALISFHFIIGKANYYNLERNALDPLHTYVSCIRYFCIRRMGLKRHKKRDDSWVLTDVQWRVYTVFTPSASNIPSRNDKNAIALYTGPTTYAIVLFSSYENPSNSHHYLRNQICNPEN